MKRRASLRDDVRCWNYGDSSPRKVAMTETNNTTDGTTRHQRRPCTRAVLNPNG
jgi:hypothetical protein